jgi:uncharacterized protein YycO
MLRKIAAAGLACLIAAIGASAQLRPEDLPPLSPGDLLFKGADSGTGARIAAGWSQGDKRWGHVGILAADGASVIHADTGENAPQGEPGEVRREPLAEYLGDVTLLGVFTVDLAGEGRAAYLAYAESAVGKPFDRGFSLQSDTALYCSELVWRALSEGAGEDIQPQKSERFGRVYVSISDLSENSLVHEAAVITAGADQGGDRRTTQAEAR